MKTQQAEVLLGATLTYRDANERNERLEQTFLNLSSAVNTFTDVLLHEAHEAMKEPLSSPPDHPFMHPVDVDTNQPGIVDQKDSLHVHRCDSSLPRIVYTRRHRERSPSPDDKQESIVVNIDKKTAEETAKKKLESSLMKAEKKALREVQAKEKRAALKAERATETPEERRERIDKAKAEKEIRKLEKQKRDEAKPPPKPKKQRVVSEEEIVCPDTSAPLTQHTRTRVPGEKVSFYQHPLPHHRHLYALQTCCPSESLLPALLEGRDCSALHIIQGPPGTGKTTEIVRLLNEEIHGRVLVCAATNVGVANLYNRCINTNICDDCALLLTPERIPIGTPVQSNDPSRRIIFATISSRCGRILDGEVFDCVIVDEAAQCMEAWVWGLLRTDVGRLILAGDINQLPACVSSSGSLLSHERSLMERLMSLGYSNVKMLTEQNRMAPEILLFPNREIYNGKLTTGPFAPELGVIRICELKDSQEIVKGTSICNEAEAREACRIAKSLHDEHNVDDIVIITPYAAQYKLLLAGGSGFEIHTVDSFQGREAEAIVLSCVRDGSSGIGFWEDKRRLAVALTRAKKYLYVVATTPDKWPDGSLLKKFCEENRS